MAKNDRTTAGPYWTRNWIEKMWRFTAENFVDFDTGAVDFEALGREEYEFRKALFYRKFKNSERAREAFVESEDLYKVNVERGKKGGRPRKETINGDAGHREAPDVSATVSDSMGRVAQNEAPAHGFSGGRAVQGAMSHAPDVAAQSGRDYDQETVSTPTISTNEDPSRGGSAATFRGSAKTQGESNTGSTVPAVRPASGNSSTVLSEARQSQARESRRTGTAVPELRRAAHSPAPVRTSGPMPEDRQAVIDFAVAEGLDVDDACECWYVTTQERDGLTADGKKINSWKAYIRKWCATRTQNRRTA